jgi:hypothetical protein
MSDQQNNTRKYTDPYAAGIVLGLVLLASFVLTGQGLGASGAFNTTAAGIVRTIAPEHAVENAWFARYLDADGPWRDWSLFEILGVIIGGASSAMLAGRWRREIERGPRISARARLLVAFIGGSVMGVGAVFARGCTSGLALSGGALLGVGSWIFIGAAFAAAFAIAPLVRSAWR